MSKFIIIDETDDDTFFSVYEGDDGLCYDVVEYFSEIQFINEYLVDEDFKPVLEKIYNITHQLPLEFIE